MSEPEVRADLQDSAAVAILYTDGVIAQPGADDRAPWRFVRCWLSLSRFHGFRDAADLARAVADFDALPAAFPARAKLASLLASAHLRNAALREPRRLAAARRLTEVAQRDPRPLPGWSATRAALAARRLPPSRVQRRSARRERFGAGRPRGNIDTLPQVIAVTAEPIEVLDPVEAAPWTFTRAWMSALRFDYLGGDASDLDQALADFARLPEWFPGRPKLAAVIVMAQMHHWVFGDEKLLAPAFALADLADQDPSPLPDWERAHILLSTYSAAQQMTNHGAGLSNPAVLDQLEQAEALFAGQPDAVEMFAAMRMGLISRTGHEFQDADLQQKAKNTGRLGRAAARGDEPTLNELLVATVTALSHSDYDALRALLPQLEEAVRTAPADEVGPEVAAIMQFVRVVAGRGGGVDARTGQVVDLDAVALADSLKAFTEFTADTPLLRATQAIATVPLLLASGDPADVDRAVVLADGVLSAGPHADEVLRDVLAVAGTAHLRRFELRGNPADLAAAVGRLEQLVENLGSLLHPMATRIAPYLVVAYRLAGRTGDLRRVTTGALRGYLWNVLLQNGPADMQSAAGSAGLFAETAARMFLDGRDPAAAAAALESCRGLILYAALESRTLDDRLTARGEHDLAAEWHTAAAADGDIPTSLRRRAVAALAGVALASDGMTPLAGVASAGAAGVHADVRLLDPPDVHEIRAALRAQGMDALVYLMPASQGPGALVVIPANDEPVALRLPQLKVEDTADFERFLVAGARSAVRGDDASGPAVGHPADPFAGLDPETLDLDLDTDLDTDPGGPDVPGSGPGSGGEDGWTPESGRSAVDRICSWAWEAAIGPLTRILPRPAGRPARVVLIPMRELSRIPWHAARRTVDGRDRYAVQDYVFSYAASARLFCETAWRPSTAAGDAGLVVGDPDTHGWARDLPGARTEAAAIRDRFYPRARYIGRAAVGAGPADGPGTPQELRAWLADPDGGPVLHLGCHGVVRLAADAGATAYLLLDSGRRLSAEELLGMAARPPGRGVALAVLAACNSDRTGRGYDEAFSLATAFLAQGVGSAISAQWSVPDDETSVLMFMLHHYVRAEGLGPLDALRAAQLWMLGDRIPPATMPESLRTLAAAHAEPPVAAWAAFVHTGKA